MPVKKLGVIALSLLVVVAGLAGWSWRAAVAIPDFYQQALDETPYPEVREQAARQFVQQTLQFVEDIRQSETWSEEFTQTQVNSWLDAHLHRYGRYVPKGVSDPRVQFEAGLLQIGFRFANRSWEGVVSLELRPSVPAPNRLVLEIEAVRAGLLPIPLEDFKLRISREFAKEGFATEWQEDDDREALLVDLNRDEVAAPVLETVEVLEGAIRIAGSREPASSSEAASANATAYQVAARTPAPPKQKVH
jgi:hypothetical protein